MEETIRTMINWEEHETPVTTPARRLARELVAQAMRDFIYGVKRVRPLLKPEERKSRAGRPHDENTAGWWLLEDRDDGPLSLEWCCDILGIDVAAARARFCAMGGKRDVA